MFRKFQLFKFCFAVTTGALLAGLILVAQQPRQVNDALLKTGSKTGDEWVSYGVNSAEQRYSPLKQIDASNVGRLGLAWSYDIPYAPVAQGNPETHQEGTPLGLQRRSVQHHSLEHRICSRSEDPQGSLEGRPGSKPANLAIENLLRRRESRHRHVRG